MSFDPNRPCIVCGYPVKSLSCGGPTICPSCDCTPARPGDRRKWQEETKAMLEKFIQEIQSLTSRLESAEGKMAVMRELLMEFRWALIDGKDVCAYCGFPKSKNDGEHKCELVQALKESA